MIYRETGQFKSSYASDQAIFPVVQDRIFVLLAVAAASYRGGTIHISIVAPAMTDAKVKRMTHERRQRMARISSSASVGCAEVRAGMDDAFLFFWQGDPPFTLLTRESTFCFVDFRKIYEISRKFCLLR